MAFGSPCMLHQKLSTAQAHTGQQLRKMPWKQYVPRLQRVKEAPQEHGEAPPADERDRLLYRAAPPPPAERPAAASPEGTPPSG